MLLVLHVPQNSSDPQSHGLYKTSDGPLWCLAQDDPLSAVSCEVEPIWTRLAVPADAWLDWDLGNLEARATPWTHHVPQTIAKQFVQCSRAHYPTERGHCHWRMLPWRGVFPQCILVPLFPRQTANIDPAVHMSKKTLLIGSGNLLPLIQSPILTLVCPM